MDRLRKALLNSWAGLWLALRTEKAVQQEALLIAIALPLAFLLTPDWWHRALLIGALLLTLSVELLNTCVETLCDHVTPTIHPQVKAIKDMGSAAVTCALVFTMMVWAVALAERVGLI